LSQERHIAVAISEVVNISKLITKLI
jgi:hypothetical protein